MRLLLSSWLCFCIWDLMTVVGCISISVISPALGTVICYLIRQYRICTRSPIRDVGVPRTFFLAETNLIHSIRLVVDT